MEPHTPTLSVTHAASNKPAQHASAVTPATQAGSIKAVAPTPKKTAQKKNTGKNTASSSPKPTKNRTPKDRTPLAQKVTKATAAKAKKATPATKKVMKSAANAYQAAAQKAGSTAKKQTRQAQATVDNLFEESFGIGANNIKQIQEKLDAFQYENARTVAGAIEKAAVAINDAIETAQESIETAFNNSNLTATTVKDINEEVVKYTNNLLGDGLELSRAFLNCRTFNDVYKFHTEALKKTFDAQVEGAAKLSEVLLDHSRQVIEPINEQLREATEKLNKSLSASVKA